MPSKKKPAPVKVDRKFMLDLAESIYSPSNRTFLRLCNGTLQNGPDPTNAKRPMHCGLGELYFAMTHHQPEEDHVNDEEVVNKAVELSAFGSTDVKRERARQDVEKLSLPEGVINTMINAIDNADDEDFETEEELEFRATLDKIPNENDSVDDSGREDFCTMENYRSRSQKVAKILRQAAKLLPS